MIAQEVIVAKSQEIHQVVDEIVTVVGDAVRDHTPIHKVEGKALKILLQAGQKALQLLVDCLGNGDMGQEHDFPMEPPSSGRTNQSRGIMYRSSGRSTLSAMCTLDGKAK